MIAPDNAGLLHMALPAQLLRLTILYPKKTGTGRRHLRLSVCSSLVRVMAGGAGEECLLGFERDPLSLEIIDWQVRIHPLVFERDIDGMCVPLEELFRGQPLTVMTTDTEILGPVFAVARKLSCPEGHFLCPMYQVAGAAYP